MASHKIFLVISLMFAVSMVNAFEFSVVDNTRDSRGGRRFRDEIGGVSYGEQSLRSATDFTWRLFQQTNPLDRKDVTKITLFMENSDGVAYSLQDEIHYNAGSLMGDSGDVRRGFTGVIYHEVVHSWQWNGAGRAPGGLAYRRNSGLREAESGLCCESLGEARWCGDRWDQGYDVHTARFLDYCNDLRNGFVAELNKKMRSDYNDGFFVDLLGKDVNQLWREYKAKAN